MFASQADLWSVFEADVSRKQVNYPVATQAKVEQMEVFCAFRGETGPDGQWGHIAQGAEVKGQGAVVQRVGEGAVAVAPGVFLKEKGKTWSLLTG